MFKVKKQENCFYGQDGGTILKIRPHCVKLNLEFGI